MHTSQFTNLTSSITFFSNSIHRGGLYLHSMMWKHLLMYFHWRLTAEPCWKFMTLLLLLVTGAHQRMWALHKLRKLMSMYCGSFVNVNALLSSPAMEGPEPELTRPFHLVSFLSFQLRQTGASLPNSYSSKTQYFFLPQILLLSETLFLICSYSSEIPLFSPPTLTCHKYYHFSFLLWK